MKTCCVTGPISGNLAFLLSPSASIKSLMVPVVIFALWQVHEQRPWMKRLRYLALHLHYFLAITRRDAKFF